MTATVIDLDRVRAARRQEAIRRAIEAGHPCTRHLQAPSDDSKDAS